MDGELKAGGGLARLEAGQVAELRMPERGGNYWTYVRDVLGPSVTVWLPETGGGPVQLPEGTEVEISVTVSSSEMVTARAQVSASGQDGSPYVELRLDASCAMVELRRRYLRVNASVPAEVRQLPDGLSPWGEAASARTLSLSPGGLSLESERTFRKGEQVAVELRLPGCGAEAVGTVLESAGTRDGKCRFSVGFTYISDCCEAAITRVIYQYQRTHGAARL